LISACSGDANQQIGKSDLEKPAPPVEYEGKTNTFVGNPVFSAKGENIYNADCTLCHGISGMGDSPAANSLNPKPKPIAREMPDLSDAYVF